MPLEDVLEGVKLIGFTVWQTISKPYWARDDGTRQKFYAHPDPYRPPPAGWAHPGADPEEQALLGRPTPIPSPPPTPRPGQIVSEPGPPGALVCAMPDSKGGHCRRVLGRRGCVEHGAGPFGYFDQAGKLQMPLPTARATSPGRKGDPDFPDATARDWYHRGRRQGWTEGYKDGRRVQGAMEHDSGCSGDHDPDEPCDITVALQDGKPRDEEP